MANYKMQKEVTTHIRGLQFSDSQADMGGGSVFWFKIVPKKNFPPEITPKGLDGFQFYKATVSGRYGYSDGTALIIIHPKITTVTPIPRASSQIFTQSYINSHQFWGVTCEYFSKIVSSGDFEVDYVIFGNSIESASQHDSALYNVRDIEPYYDHFLPIGPLLFVEGRFS